MERKTKAVKKKFSIVVAGPTAVGKTAAAIHLAKWLQTSIISADSRQCYKELSIGVARPSEAELQAVQHHFIASHSILEELNAAGFAAYALAEMEQLFQLHDEVVVVGGTGLYIKALTEGLDAIPPTDPEIRASIIREYEAKGLGWLQQAVQEQDPAYYASGEIQNPQRLMRALEVVRSTGKSIRNFQTGTVQQRPFHTLFIGLELPRQELINRINQRVDQMMQDGLLKEVEAVAELLRSTGRPLSSISALQTVGYSEIFAFLDGQSSLNDAVERIKIHTRQYAKRQMTWFKKLPAINWFHPQDLEGMQACIQAQILQ